MTRRWWSPTPLGLALLLATALLPTWARCGDDRPVTRVGMRARLEGIVLPGPELEVRRLEDSQAPFVLRIVNAYPHGTAFRYDFECYGLEPRVFNLTEYLKPKDGSQVSKLPAVEIEVKGLLAPGLVHPHALETRRSSWFAGYRLLLVVAGVIWVSGLGFVLFWGRRGKRAAAQLASQTVTFAERLRPLVVRAMTGLLAPSQQAELERMLLAYWRRRLGLEGLSAPAALARLRLHPEAGELLTQLELWLHRPGANRQVDLGKLLWPYRDVAANESEQADTTGVRRP